MGLNQATSSNLGYGVRGVHAGSGYGVLGESHGGTAGYFTSPTDAALSGGGIIIARDGTDEIAIDGNELMARKTNGGTRTLYLNRDGGDVSISSNGSGKLIAPVI